MSLKILFLSHYFHPHIGGIETFSEVLAKAFVEAGHEVHLVTWTKENGTEKFPFEIIRNPTRRQLFHEHSWANVVFENNPCLRLSWPAFLYRRPSVIVLQTWLAGMNQRLSISELMKHLWLRRAKKVIAISEAVRARCCPHASIIANSYNVNHFKIYSGIQRNKDFIFVGRLVSDKGAVIAIKALHQLVNESRSMPNTRQYSLTIVGAGPEKVKLQQTVKELKLELYVQFEGSLTGPKLAICLNRHKYLFVPSLWEEPFGIVALEGMACGCIPIVSDGGGLPDAVGDAGLTFKKGNVNDFVRVIKTVIDDPPLQHQLREYANAHISAHHPRNIAGKYLGIIEDAIEVPIHS
ncbi:MAG TPA: glycosyltransferase family 4 protein [Flavitalea sp.]|nr:glycosyltransferase family 4 protein [Flavitalea sp.]